VETIALGMSSKFGVGTGLRTAPLRHDRSVPRSPRRIVEQAGSLEELVFTDDEAERLVRYGKIFLQLDIQYATGVVAI